MKGQRIILAWICEQKEEQQMELIEWILQDSNIAKAIEQVKRNKGAAGIDNMTVDEVKDYFAKYGEEIKSQIRNKQYKPTPVKRVYIPKANGKKRPLGIPIVIDRVIQQAVAQILTLGYEKYFSDHSMGFRPQRGCHQAIDLALTYLNEGYEWVIDMDIAKYFDTVNHDKLISILRERINDAPTLHLIRSFLKAGIMEEGMFKESTEGVPQGGPLSPILANVYLDKLDKELEARGLRFVRYADDCDIFVKSEKAADRVMQSVTGWIERKLFLKVSAEKTKVVRPTKSQFLGFTFWKQKDEWKCKPTKERFQKLYDKCKQITLRRKAGAKRLAVTITKLNQVVRGWINYFKIGGMKSRMKEFGEWLRHKVRVIILKQWKNPSTIIKNLSILNRIVKCRFTDEEIYKVGNSRLGWYRRAGMYVANYAIHPKLLKENTKSRPGLVDPLEYYLSRI